MRKPISILAALLFCSCSSMNPRVISAGPGQYIVGSSGGIYTQNIAPIRERVYTAANQYCASNHMVMIPVKVDERPYVLGHNTCAVTLTFKMEPKIK